MDILNNMVSVERLQAFIEKHKEEKGIIYIRTNIGSCDDMRLLFVKNAVRYHHMPISSSQILELSHTVPGLEFCAPGYENEPLHYHSDRVKAYVMAQGYYVWGNSNEFAEWVCFTNKEDVDRETCFHYGVHEDTINRLLTKPRSLTHGYKGAKTSRVSMVKANKEVRPSDSH